MICEIDGLVLMGRAVWGAGFLSFSFFSHWGAV